MTIAYRWRDTSGIDRLTNAMHELGPERFAKTGSRALNHTGKKARTKVRRALAKHTGLKYAVMVRAVREAGASPARLAYTLRSTGGDVALRYFGPRETRAGVSAAPFGKRQVFAGKFMRGGRFPNRVQTGLFGGHVVSREGTGKWPVSREKSGVVIPAEMVKGVVADEWSAVVDRELPHRLIRDLARAGSRAFS